MTGAFSGNVTKLFSELKITFSISVFVLLYHYLIQRLAMNDLSLQLSVHVQVLAY